MAKAADKEPEGRKVIATNRRAFHDYHVLERYEAGIKLTGAEVKSLRAGHCVISDAHATVDKKKSLAWLMNLQIPEWNRGNQIVAHEPKRKRALLMHKHEILKLRQKLQEQGLTLIPLSIYFKHGFAKVELGVCKGKKLYDKREALKEKQAKREIARRVKR
ncbi:MAG: SsrA-binding protein SmpB [Planctomycetota bacterium]|nr:SsrA-binding protein SmpB [Planctomycetota bacterium]